MGELYDFTEFKMHQLIEHCADINRADIATEISNALDSYLLGDIRIEFVDGWPIAYDTEESAADT